MKQYHITFVVDTTMEIPQLIEYYIKMYEGKYYKIPKGVTEDPKRIVKVELIKND